MRSFFPRRWISWKFSQHHINPDKTKNLFAAQKNKIRIFPQTWKMPEKSNLTENTQFPKNRLFYCLGDPSGPVPCSPIMVGKAMESQGKLKILMEKSGKVRDYNFKNDLKHDFLLRKLAQCDLFESIINNHRITHSLRGGFHAQGHSAHPKRIRFL